MPPLPSKPKSAETSETLGELPAFDSIPATAGLTNVEAFQLSVRHALSLLPAVAATTMATWDEADEPERFSFR